MTFTIYLWFQLLGDSDRSDSYPHGLWPSIDDLWQIASIVESAGVNCNAWNCSLLGDELAGLQTRQQAEDTEFIHLIEESVAE